MAFKAWLKTLVLLPLAVLVLYHILSNNPAPQAAWQAIAPVAALLALALGYDAFVGYWHEVHPTAPPAPPEEHEPGHGRETGKGHGPPGGRGPHGDGHGGH